MDYLTRHTTPPMNRSLAVLALVSSLNGSAQRLVPIGNGIPSGSVEAMVEFDGKLIVGGLLQTFNDSAVTALASMDTNGTIEQLWPYPELGTVKAMIEHLGALCVAYTRTPGIKGVARWDGLNWSELGPSFDQPVLDLTIFNGELIAVGAFTMIGGSQIAGVARWDGSNWQALGSPPNAPVRAALVQAPDLYIGGEFTSIGGAPIMRMAKWDGADWVSVGPGLDGTVLDIASIANAIWIVGGFDGTADQSLTLNGSTVWDGLVYSQLSSIDFTASHVLEIPQWGPVLSNGTRSIFHPLTPDPIERPYGIRSAVEFDGSILCSGTIATHSYALVQGIGKLLPGEKDHVLNIADMSVRVSAYFGLGYDGDQGVPEFIVPASSGASTIFDHVLVAAAKQGADLYVTPSRYYTVDHSGFNSGPMCSDTNTAYFERYGQVWSVDNGMVWGHAEHYADPGYESPYPIDDWPGNGDPQNGEALVLAPFADPNNNGAYEPLQGELPLFDGDAAVLSIGSDVRSGDGQGNGPIGLDVITYTYGFDVPSGDPLQHVLFQDHLIINRSSNSYDTLWIGSYTDMDIGSAQDDFIGCDSVLNMGYGYNGDTFDETTMVPGYGAHPPAQGVQLLNAPMSAFSYYSTPGIPWSEDTLFYQLLRGRTYDGTYSGMMFPGDPNDPNQDNEISWGNDPDDRRFVMSFGPWYNVAPGDTICLDIALVFAQDSLGDNLSSVSLLKQRAAAVKAWYDQQPLSCGQYLALGVQEASLRAHAPFLIHPNPAQNSITLQREVGPEALITIRDPQGKLLKQVLFPAGGNECHIDITALSQGTYLIGLEYDHGTSWQRLIVTR